MSKRNLIISATIIFVLSLIGIGLWLFEIQLNGKWNVCCWFNRLICSPYITTLTAVLAFITPFIVNRQITKVKIIFPTIILCFVCFLCFFVGKQICFSVYARRWFSGWSTVDIVGAGILFTIIGAAFWFVTNKFIKKNRTTNILFITLFALATIPLSFLTSFATHLYPDMITTVKMGYPVFWITMMLGLSGIIIASQKSFLQHK